VAIDENLVAAAPRTVELADAAALPLAGLTAQQALGAAHLDVGPGDNLLVTGGAGGVGLLAIQLAKWHGAHVTTTASTLGRELVLAVGADEVIDYHTQKISAVSPPFDKVFDLVGGDALGDVVSATRRGGRVVSVTGPLTAGSVTADIVGLRRAIVRAGAAVMSRGIRKRAAGAGVSYEHFFMAPDGAGLAELSGLVDDGALTLTVDSRFAFSDFRSAFARLESRHAKGKVVIELPA